MVHDVVYLFSVEFMQYGHYHRPIRQRGQESHCPVGRVTAAHGHLVTFLYTGSLHHDMQLLYLACHVVIL